MKRLLNSMPLAAAVLLGAGLFVAAPAIAAKHVAAATPTPSPSPTPAEDPNITKIARKQFLAWQAGTVNRDLYTVQMQGQMTAQRLTDTSNQLGQLGAFKTSQFIGPVLVDDAPAGSQSFLYRMICANGQVYMQFGVMPDGKIAGVLFSQKAPGDDSDSQ